MKEETYYCDRCGIKVGSVDAIGFVSEQSAFFINVERELCFACFADIKGAISGAMRQAGTK